MLAYKREDFVRSGGRLLQRYLLFSYRQAFSVKIYVDIQNTSNPDCRSQSAKI